MKYNFDCVIIGSGIAGMTSAIYLKRANLNILILDKDAPGGLLNKINKIENYPGYTSISGPELAYKIYEQVKNLNIEIRYGKVISIDNHVIKTDIEEITANKIIIATGRQAKKLDNANGLKNISYCAVCDANFYRNKVVALVGNDNQSIEECIYLKDICKEVIFICKDKLVGEEVLIEKINNSTNIRLLEKCVINTLNKQGDLLTSITTNQGEFEIDGMFISIGYEPKVDFLESIKTENGYIIVNEKMQTNIDYIYACGDIIKKDIYQLTTAAAEATIAAINIKKNKN